MMKFLISFFRYRSWFYYLSRFILLFFVRLRYGLTVISTNNVPKTGGAIIAANHISYFDPPILGVCIARKVNFLAKKELFGNPFSYWLMHSLYTFPVDRSRSDMKALKEAIRLLKAGEVVGIFIQGTRNKGDGEAMDGAAFLAQRAGVPILPAAIWREGRKFSVECGKAIFPEGKSKTEMEELTKKTMEGINALLDKSLVPSSNKF